MISFRSALLSALLAACVAAPAALAQPGVTVRDRIEQARPTSAEKSDSFNEGLLAYDKGNYARAFEIWLPLAQQDDLAAMRNVALLLKEGRGTQPDAVRALYFFERAGRGGLVSAQVNTAFMYLNGEGTAQDYRKASFWFHAAAIGGVPAARYNLAVLYENGLGVDRDPARALAWYALAAQSGHGMALKRLTEIVPSLPGPAAQEPEDAAVSTPAPPPPPAEIDGMAGATP